MKRLNWSTVFGLLAGTLMAGIVVTGSAMASDLKTDWNQFRGPNRDNLCKETGLADRWPEGGPELLQTITGIGEGYASVSLVGEMMYTMGNVDGGEHIIALNRKTGEIVWKGAQRR